MTGRCWVLLVVAACSFGAFANQAPTADDLSLATWADTTTSFTVAARDADIDPFIPDLHPLEFRVVVAPAHGAVTADLDLVSYEAPHVARVAMAYTPAGGFTGIDRFVWEARDVLGQSVRATVEIEVRSRTGTASLSGDMFTSLSFDLQTDSLVSSFNAGGTIVYRIDALSLNARALFKRDTSADSLFEDLKLSLSHPIDGLGMFSTAFTFDPDPATPLTRAIDASANLNVGGAALVATFHTPGIQTEATVALSASGRLGDVPGATVAISMLLRTCSPVFDSAAIRFGFGEIDCGEAPCGVSLAAGLKLTCAGLESITATLGGVALPAKLFGGASTTFDVAFVYELDEKTADVSIDWSTPWVDCIRFDTELVGAGGAINGLRVRSLHLRTTCIDGLTLRMDTSLDPTDLALNSRVTGHVDYWERDVLSGTFGDCSGIGGRWEVAVYFLRPGVANHLFSWGMTDLYAEVGCGATWSFYGRLIFRSGDLGTSTGEAEIGFRSHW